MNIVVCLKQVPRDNTVAITPQKAIDASGIEMITNLFDEYAMEAALQINDSLGGEVTVVSLGGDDWVDQIRRALAMGATDSLLVHHTQEIDVYAAATILTAAAKRTAAPQLIVCGRNATDDDSAAMAPMIARMMGWSHVTYVSRILSSSDSHLEVERVLEDEQEVVRVSLPAVLSISKGDTEPRFPSLLRVRKFAKAEVPTVTVDALGVQVPSVARLHDRVPPAARKSGEIIEGADVASKVAALVDRLSADQAL